MTEDPKYEIAVLAEDYELKRSYFQALGLLNVAGKTTEERVKMTIDYHQAETLMKEAEHRLYKAKQSIIYGTR